MAYKIKATFPAGVTQAEVEQFVQSLGVSPENPAPGNLSHTHSVENGQVVFHEEWESKAVFESFLQQTAGPGAAQAGIPLPEIEEV